MCYLYLIVSSFIYKPAKLFSSPDASSSNVNSDFLVIDEANPSRNWITRLETGFAFGRFLGFKKSYAEFGLFNALNSTGKWLSFVDLRGYLINPGRWGGSIGTGLRTWNEKRQRVLGGNIYYDYRPTSIASFQRIGVGIECLGKVWDLRVNGYFLVHGSIKQGRLHTFHFEGGFVETCRIKEYAFKGIDAEIGYRVGQPDRLFLYGALGPYYYTSHHKEIFGGYARLQLAWLEHFMLELNVSHDKKFQTQCQGKVMITFPIDKIFNIKNLMGEQDILLTQPVQRNPMIPTQRAPHYKQNW